MAMVEKKVYSIDEEVVSAEEKAEYDLPSYVSTKRIIPVKFMPSPSNEGDDGHVYLTMITSVQYYDADGRQLSDFNRPPVTQRYDLPVTSRLDEIIAVTEHDVTVDEDAV